MASAVQRWGTAVVAVAALASLGCGQKVTVSGRVTHQGKPVSWGGVSLVASDDVMYSGKIEPDGTFSIPGVPVGRVKIGTSSPNPNGTHPAPSARATASVRKGTKSLSREQPVAERKSASDESKPHAGSWFALPTKYADPINSGLTGVVKRNQSLDIDIP